MNFIEVNEKDSAILINLSTVAFIEKQGRGTTIRFNSDKYLHVTNSYEELKNKLFPKLFDTGPK